MPTSCNNSEAAAATAAATVSDIKPHAIWSSVAWEAKKKMEK